MKSDFFLKVLHEEPLDKVSLEAIKGGDVICTCNLKTLIECTVDCQCDGTETLLICKCHGRGNFNTCSPVAPICGTKEK